MSDWSDLSLPHPQRNGYVYPIASAILRSPVDAAQPQQTRKWRTNKKTFSLTFLLTQAELQVAQGFLDDAGYTWFTLDLVSGEVAGAPLVGHSVRLIEDPRVVPTGMDTYTLTMTVEHRAV